MQVAGTLFFVAPEHWWTIAALGYTLLGAGVIVASGIYLMRRERDPGPPP